MHGPKKLRQIIQHYTLWLEKFADRPWYPLMIGLLAALDSFLLVIPTDGILIASSIIIPKRWPLFALSTSLGSTLGASALGLLVRMKGLPWILEFYPTINQTEFWFRTEKFFLEYGLLVVFGVSASPFMQQPAIILAGLAAMPFWSVAVTLFAGRILKYLFMGYLASHSPKLLKKIWGMKDELEEVGVKID